MKCKLILIFLLLFSSSCPVISQENADIETLKARIHQLEGTVFQLKNEQQETKKEMSRVSQALQRSGVSLILFAFFCAWWAKSTGRSSLQWFLLGALFHVFTAIVLLAKTERGTLEQIK